MLVPIAAPNLQTHASAALLYFEKQLASAEETSREYTDDFSEETTTHDLRHLEPLSNTPEIMDEKFIG